MNERPDRSLPRTETLPYVGWAIAAGVVGAAIVAVFFLVVDALEGRPLATPTALGTTIFQDEPFSLDRPVDLLMVAGYSAVHLGSFIGLTLIPAAILFGRKTRPPTHLLATAGLAIVLFAATTLVAFGFYLASGASLWTELGEAMVTGANLLAACGMALVLRRGFRTRWRPENESIDALAHLRRHAQVRPDAVRDDRVGTARP
jgi:hypothetical protein